MQHKRLRTIVITVVASLFLSGIGVSSASADTTATPTWTVAHLSTAREARVVKAAGQHVQVSGGARLAVGTATILRGSDRSIAVVWRISGAGVNPFSTATVLLDSALTFRESGQQDFTPDTAGGGVERGWRNGVLLKTVHVSGAQLARAAASSAPASPLSGTSAVSRACLLATVALVAVIALSAIVCALGTAAGCIAAAAAIVVATAFAKSQCG